MESNKQEKYNLLHDNPVAKHASGSWMSKHSQQSRLGGSPLHNDEDKKAEYEKTIRTAQTQKANPAEVSAKLRDTYPEVKNEKVEVNWSPDGKQVEVHPKKETTGGRA